MSEQGEYGCADSLINLYPSSCSGQPLVPPFQRGDEIKREEGEGQERGRGGNNEGG